MQQFTFQKEIIKFLFEVKKQTNTKLKSLKYLNKENRKSTMLSKIAKFTVQNAKNLKAFNLTHTPLMYFAAKELSFSIDCRNHMLRGCEKLADAVQVTLGKKKIHLF